MKKKTLVTGGAGFIGSHIVDLLLEEGHHVTVLDNFCNSTPQNLAKHQHNSSLSVQQIDIRDAASLRGYFEGVEWVFHLAALADIVPSIKNAKDYYDTNVTGTFNVLEAAKNAGVKKFLYAASSSCYGLPSQIPTPESSPIAPEYPYALTKNMGEMLVMHWGQVYGLPVQALRLFNVYGPRSRTSGTYGAVFGVFLAQKNHQKPFTVVGDGTQTRDFTYVTDVANAFVATAKSSFSQTIWNVGSGNTYSINRLTELLGGDVVYIPKRPGEPDATFADITAITSAIEWRPTVSFEQGVAQMLAHQLYWKDAPVWTSDAIAEATQDWFKYLGK